MAGIQLQNKQLRPYPLHPHQRMRGGRAMTIAIGARCSDGVIVCADSEFTHGEIHKSYDWKIFEFAEPDWSSRLVMAFSGSVQFAKMFIESAGKHFLSLPDRTAENTEGMVGDLLVDFYQRHIYPHPKFQLYGGPDFQLIVGIKGSAGGLRLLSTVETAVAKIEVCESIGIGQYLVRHLLRAVHFPSMNMEEAHLAIASAMNEAKNSVPACGGKNQFFLLGEKSRSIFI
jgi:20S proteasome alpha/beta subunit